MLGRATSEEMKTTATTTTTTTTTNLREKNQFQICFSDTYIYKKNKYFRSSGLTENAFKYVLKTYNKCIRHFF